MDRIDLFRIFVRVVECQSFTRAAGSLGLPRSSVSAAVQELEGRVGARLLSRTTRRVAPTLDGLAFHEHCSRLIADVEEAEGLFRRSGADAAGHLRVDAPGRIGRRIITPALPRFLDRHPGIAIMLGVTDRAVDLIEEGVDCVIRVGALTDSGLVARPLGSLTLVNVASPGYLARFGIPRHPDDLDRHQAVAYASPTSGRVEPWEWLDQGAPLTRQIAARVTVNSAEALIAAAAAGLGLIQVPAYDVTEEIAAGALTEVMPDHRAAPMPITLLYPHRRHLSRRLQLFADWVGPLIREQTMAG